MQLVMMFASIYFYGKDQIYDFSFTTSCKTPYIYSR